MAAVTVRPEQLNLKFLTHRIAPTSTTPISAGAEVSSRLQLQPVLQHDPRSCEKVLHM